MRETLNRIARSADELHEMVLENQEETRKERRSRHIMGIVLAICIAVIAIGGLLVVKRFHDDTERDRMRTVRVCERANESRATVKDSLITLVTLAVESSTTPEGRLRGQEFLATYKVRLDRELAPTNCSLPIS